MGAISTGTTNIKFGSSLRIGYRQAYSASAFTYVATHPSYDQLPYSFSVPTPGLYEIEYTEVCPNCSGGIYSDPVIVVVNVLN